MSVVAEKKVKWHLHVFTLLYMQDQSERYLNYRELNGT